MLSYAYQLSQSVSISVYGGPEYTYLNETLPAQTIGGLPTSIHKPEWDWSAGFSASATTNRTTFFLAGSRAVSSAGGLLAAVNSDFGSLGVSRRLPWNWTGTMTVGYGEYQALKFGGLQNGKITTGVGNISFGHQLGERLTLGLRYNYTQQRGSVSGVAGLAAGYENLNRNVASIGIDWAIGKYHLGH